MLLTITYPSLSLALLPASPNPPSSPSALSAGWSPQSSSTCAAAPPPLSPRSSSHALKLVSNSYRKILVCLQKEMLISLYDFYHYEQFTFAIKIFAICLHILSEWALEFGGTMLNTIPVWTSNHESYHR